MNCTTLTTTNHSLKNATNATRRNATRSEITKPNNKCRFIHSREFFNVDVASMMLKTTSCYVGLNKTHMKLYTQELSTSLNFQIPNKILPLKPLKNDINSFTKRQKIKKTVDTTPPTQPVLDAPHLIDDFYTSNLDWSREYVIVSLGNEIYTWNNGQIENIEQLPNLRTHTSLACMPMNQNTLAVSDKSLNRSYLRLIDIPTRRYKVNWGRVASPAYSLSWDNDTLACGFEDVIKLYDTRSSSISCIIKHSNVYDTGHKICGLEWSPFGNYLVSGGTDNCVNVWDKRRPHTKVNGYSHEAGVKALAWNPTKRNVLASGGGVNDHCIRIQNINTNEFVDSINTGSHICGIKWSKNGKEFVSAHGFTYNNISVWKYPSMIEHKKLIGHKDRILHMALSPNNTTIATASSDETIRFWDVFSSTIDPVAAKNVYSIPLIR